VWGDPVDGGLVWHDKLEATKNNKCFETWMHEDNKVEYLTTETSDVYPLPKRCRFMADFIDLMLKNP
jgi:hypothetical protein